MVNSSTASLEQKFRTLGVDQLQPGFYDHPAFIKAEMSNPKLLEDYAAYVVSRHMPQSYIERTRSIVVRLMTIIDEATAKAPRGSCRDSAAVLSRILDRLGIWNFTVQGSFNIEVEGLGEEGRRFLWFDDELDPGAGTRGHQWVVAPPFRILDAAVKWQGWEPEVLKAIGSPLAVENTNPTSIRVSDVFPENMQYEAFILHGLTEAELLAHYRPDVTEIYATVPPQLIERGKVRFRYIPVGITASEEPLEQIAGETLKPMEIWNRHIQPEFADFLTEVSVNGLSGRTIRGG